MVGKRFAICFLVNLDALRACLLTSMWKDRILSRMTRGRCPLPLDTQTRKLGWNAKCINFKTTLFFFNHFKTWKFLPDRGTKKKLFRKGEIKKKPYYVNPSSLEWKNIHYFKKGGCRSSGFCYVGVLYTATPLLVYPSLPSPRVIPGFLLWLHYYPILCRYFLLLQQKKWRDIHRICYERYAIGKLRSVLNDPAC